MLVYLALRAALLAWRFDELCNPSFELTMIGNLAHAVSSGRGVLPLSGYFDNCGGHIVSGLLAAPLYLALDDSYLVLKLVPMLQGLLTLLLAWAIVAPRAGRAAATLACIAFALGPPVLARLSVMAMGNHFESLLPTFACYLAWLRWRERGARADALLFGLTAGLAVFLYLGSLLWLAVLAAVHLRAAGARATARDALRMAPGLAVGLLPLAWIAFEAGARIANFFRYNLGGEARPEALEGVARAWGLAVRVLPTSGLYPDLGALPGALAEACLFAACALAWLVVARASSRGGPEHTRTLPLVLYPPLLVLALAFSRFDIEPAHVVEHATTRRYLAPYFGLFALLLGFAHGELARSRRPRLATGLAALLLVTAPFAIAIALPPQRRAPSGTHLRGWSGAHFARLLLRDVRDAAPGARPAWDVEAVARRVNALPETERAEVAFGLGLALAQIDPRDPFEPVEPFAAALPGPLAEHAAEGVGAWLRLAYARGVLDREHVRASLERLAARRPEPARAAVRGLSREVQPAVETFERSAADLARELEFAVPEGLRCEWALGLGRVAPAAP